MLTGPGSAERYGGIEMNDKICYFNGDYLRESEVKLPIWDMGFFYGWGAYEVARTFNHIPFKLKDHVDRLFRSLAYIQVDPGLTPEAVHDITLELLNRNVEFYPPNEDYWAVYRVTTGPVRFTPATGPTVLFNCADLSYREMAKNYIDGIHLVVVNTRQVPVQCLDPKAKLMNRLPQRLANLEAQMVDPKALPLMLDINGFLAEGSSFNFFIVSGGRLLTPKDDNILQGITRAAILELAGKIGLERAEVDLSVYDLYNADEIFTTSTSFTIYPVAKLDNRPLPGPIPGPVTQKLISSWSKMVGMDIIKQCTSHLQS